MPLLNCAPRADRQREGGRRSAAGPAPALSVAEKSGLCLRARERELAVFHRGQPRSGVPTERSEPVRDVGRSQPVHIAADRCFLHAFGTNELSGTRTFLTHMSEQ